MIIEAIIVLQVVNLAGFGLMFWFERSDAQSRLDMLKVLRVELLYRDARHDAMLKAYDKAAYKDGECAMNQFKPGDLVLLKSGGPVMTVNNWLESFWICTWFCERGYSNSSGFSEAALEKVSPS